MSTPHWPDHCEHLTRGGRFLGTIWHDELHVPVDVYVFPNIRPESTDVCLRYGPMDSQYISPGDARDFVQRTRLEPEKYQGFRLTAAALIDPVVPRPISGLEGLVRMACVNKSTHGGDA